MYIGPFMAYAEEGAPPPPERPKAGVVVAERFAAQVLLDLYRGLDKIALHSFLNFRRSGNVPEAKCCYSHLICDFYSTLPAIVAFQHAVARELPAGA
jgi:hypothetical protein